ncbi:hypothetical protein VNI00_003315 [Paramarasmius palmivorus]|uniref:Uncharacterized protein n=1 Tax=Paramarasmius palmivorus TaxID=297713 RepID=A0AAW0DSM3_9AGAR
MPKAGRFTNLNLLPCASRVIKLALSPYKALRSYQLSRKVMSDISYTSTEHTALPELSAPLDPLGIQQKYEEERAKRLRPEGAQQFVELHESQAYSYLGKDVWVDHAALNAQKAPLEDGASIQTLILGAGYGGLNFAVRLIEAGFKPKDIRLVDIAGGFGGTWYWNRYPGLMCDIESYIYMPLLEETGYMPKHKYAYGPELRYYANLIAEKWDLVDKAMFRSEVKAMDWDDGGKMWVVGIEEYRGPNEAKRTLTVRAQFVMLAVGSLNFPHIPKIPGMDSFKGHMFHTSRWDYAYTGGSPDDWTMSSLKDKRVGMLGTGATAVQVVPQLAEWSKELFVFQRTPPSVDAREQHQTNPQVWQQEIATHKGWQRERQLNFASYVSNAPIGPNMVNDGWTTSPAFSAFFGGPKHGIISPEKVPIFLGNMFALDMERAIRIRARVDEIVHDPETAEQLKPWYPIPMEKVSNASLRTGVVANGKEHPIDDSDSFGGSGSPGYGIVIHGRNGLNLEKKWAQGIATLHGIFTRDFPNLFFFGPSQIAVLASHIVHIVSETLKRGGKAAEPTKEAEEQWAAETVKRSTASMAALAGCTPGYFNREGELSQLARAPIEVQKKAARGALWGEGIPNFMENIEEWREKNGLEGVEVTG